MLVCDSVYVCACLLVWLWSVCLCVCLCAVRLLVGVFVCLLVK